MHCTLLSLLSNLNLVVFFMPKSSASVCGLRNQCQAVKPRQVSQRRCWDSVVVVVGWLLGLPNPTAVILT